MRIYFFESKYFLTCYNTLNRENIAVNDAAVSITDFSNFTLSNCTFKSNFAGESCGGIRLSADSSINITTSFFINNTCNIYGGSIGTANNAQVNISDSYFHNGKALQGGIIYAEDSSIYTIQNCFFDNNTGSDGGYGL